MRKRLLNGVNMKIAAATSVVIFTLLVSFVGVFAWFEAVTEAHTQNDDFKIEKLDDAITNIELYDYHGVSGNYYLFESEPEWSIDISQTGVSHNTLNMEQYETDNPHKPVLLLFTVSGSLTYIGAETAHNYITEVLDMNSFSATNNYLSSILEFRSIEYTKTGAGSFANSKQGGYPAISKTIIEDEDTGKSFASFDNGEYEDIDQSIELYSGNTADFGHIGIIIDYYAVSIEYIYSYYMGHDALNNLNGVKFTCDWSMKV